MALLYRMGTGNGSGGDLKPYIVQFTCDSGYIGQTLTMTYKGTPHAGEVVEDVSGIVVLDSTDGKGKLTLYPMHSGNWECSCYSSVTGTIMKKTIELTYWGTTNVEFNDIPDGATVTPTDDVQTWLHCVNIWDKSYTTISEVVADTTTLNTLIANENANDYLVRSTTFATDICNNESAMTYIGLNDYCANKLLADSTWSTAICDSPYFKKVLTVNVPTLNEDSSLVFSSSDYNNDLAKWKAFNGINSGYGWLPNIRDKNPYVGYEFANPVIIKKVAYFLYYNGNPTTYNGKTLKVKATNDNSKPFSEWQELFTISGDVVTATEYDKNINNNIAYKYYAFNHNMETYGSGWHIQFYGR